MEKTDITKEDVDAICVTQIANHIFDMVNAVAEKQQKKPWIYTTNCLH